MIHEPPRAMPAPAAASPIDMMWLPARDQATAERLYRVVPKYADQSLTLQAFINKGWTLAALLEHGYAEAVPALPSPGIPAWGSSPDTCQNDTPGPVKDWHITRPQAPSDIAASVVDQVLARDAHGLRKYGVSLDRTDLDTPDWLQHMAEELMDGAHYALAAKRELERRSQAIRDNYSKALKTTQDQARAMLSEADYKVAERVLKVFNTALYELELSK